VWAIAAGIEGDVPQHYDDPRPNSLAADQKLLQIQLHQVLKVGFQIFLAESGEKFRLGTLIDFADTVYQLPFAHAHTSFKSGIVLSDLRNIDRPNAISLARGT